MDNKSARGITATSSPTTNEVCVRSGEGRSGKSTGQFVEKEATARAGATRRRASCRRRSRKHGQGHLQRSAGGATGGRQAILPGLRWAARITRIISRTCSSACRANRPI
jgi:hypothetical protein